MKSNAWGRTFTCAAAIVVSTLLSSPCSRATDQAPPEGNEKPISAATKDTSPEKEETKRPAKPKRKKNPKASEESAPANASDSNSTKPSNFAPKTDAPASDLAIATALLGNLSPEHMKSLGQMIEQDWKDRPEWGEMAIAILKNDYMRPGTGWWKPGSKRYDWKWLSDRFDANKDGRIERDEFPKDVTKADQLFERLDRDGDGELRPADFDYSDPNPATMFMNVAAMKGMMSNQLFNRLDQDSNGRVTMQELADFFHYADQEQLEFLTPEDLRFAIDEPRPKKKRIVDAEEDPASAGPSTPASALRMFLKGELGWLSSGPQLGDAAPDFTLPTHDGTAKITLSDSFGKRPVVLVFGSFT